MNSIQRFSFGDEPGNPSCKLQRREVDTGSSSDCAGEGGTKPAALATKKAGDPKLAAVADPRFAGKFARRFAME